MGPGAGPGHLPSSLKCCICSSSLLPSMPRAICDGKTTFHAPLEIAFFDVDQTSCRMATVSVSWCRFRRVQAGGNPRASTGTSFPLEKVRIGVLFPTKGSLPGKGFAVDESRKNRRTRDVPVTRLERPGAQNRYLLARSAHSSGSNHRVEQRERGKGVASTKLPPSGLVIRLVSRGRRDEKPRRHGGRGGHPLLGIR